jgi:hypothetical protein
MKVIFEKKNYSFVNMKSYLDTHLRVVHMVLIASEEVYSWALFFFFNFGSFLAQVLPDPDEVYLEKVEYGFKNIK